MDLIADGLLIATALTAALYCVILSRRLRRLTDAEAGIGTQIRALNKALEETRTALAETRRGVAEARGSARSASDALGREVAAARETLVALERAQALAEARLDAALGTQGGSGDVPPDRTGGAEGGGAGLASPDPRHPEDADPADDIPDWPDGVVPVPEDLGATPPVRSSAAPALASPRPEGPIRVERMSL